MIITQLPQPCVADERGGDRLQRWFPIGSRRTQQDLWMMSLLQTLLASCRQ